MYYWTLIFFSSFRGALHEHMDKDTPEISKIHDGRIGKETVDLSSISSNENKNESK